MNGRDGFRDAVISLLCLGGGYTGICFVTIHLRCIYFSECMF